MSESEPTPPGAAPEPTRGYFEEYKCGCVSGVVRYRRQLVGYCGRHGSDRRRVHRVDPRLDKKHWERTDADDSE